MATYKVRGASHNVIYTYRTSTGQAKQQWESYDTELEAVQRKAYIELLQSQKRTDELRQAALDYKRSRAIEKAASKIARDRQDDGEPAIADAPEENLTRTYREWSDFCQPTPGSETFRPKPMTATKQI